MFCRDRSRRHRDRGYYPGYPPYGYYGDSDAYESYERYSYATRKRKKSTCVRRSCLLCNGEFREPYEALSCYDTFEDCMNFVHECYMGMETGRFITQGAADKIEEASKMINRAFGYDPIYKQYSGFLKQLAREVQLLPDQAQYWSRPRRPRLPTSYWFS